LSFIFATVFALRGLAPGISKAHARGAAALYFFGISIGYVARRAKLAPQAADAKYKIFMQRMQDDGKIHRLFKSISAPRAA